MAECPAIAMLGKGRAAKALGFAGQAHAECRARPDCKRKCDQPCQRQIHALDTMPYDAFILTDYNKKERGFSGVVHGRTGVESALPPVADA